MKEESEVYERSTREGTSMFLNISKSRTPSDPDFLTSIPAPPYIPYKPMPFFFAPNPQCQYFLLKSENNKQILRFLVFPLPGSRIFARPSSLVMEKQPRQQLPLRGIYYR